MEVLMAQHTTSLVPTPVRRGRSSTWLWVQQQAEDRYYTCDQFRWRKLLFDLAVVVSASALVALGLGRGVSHVAPGSSVLWADASLAATNHADLREARDIYTLMDDFDDGRFDRLDVVVTNFHITLSNYPNLVRDVLDRSAGRIRVLALDPTLATTDPKSFAGLAECFGQSPAELEAEARLSVEAIRRFKASLPPKARERLEFKLYSDRDGTAQPGYLVPFRSYHRYEAQKPTNRLDVVVPYGINGNGIDSPMRAALVVQDRPDEADVVDATRAFDRIWAAPGPLL